jgi:hypothetical protein
LNRVDSTARGVAHAQESYLGGQQSIARRIYQRFDIEKLRKRPIAE